MTAGFSSGVPFAVDGAGRWRDIDAVPRGKACACFCAECNAELIARKGEIRTHHFAHSDRKECQDALQASLFGMAVKILSEPGAELQLPPPFSVSDMSLRTGRAEREVREAMLSAGLDDRLRGEKLTLHQPIAHVARVQDSRPEKPEIESRPGNLSLHLLSNRKRLPALSHQEGDASRMLAINLIAFVWRWYQVCDRRNQREKDLASSTVNEFRTWLATSTEGRGWVFNPQRADAEQKLRLEFEKTAAIAPKKNSSIVPFFTPVYSSARSPMWSPPKRPVLPEQPDAVLSKGAGKCRLCSAPLDEIRMGSGLFNGKRMLVCSLDRKHPMVHLGA